MTTNPELRNQRNLAEKQRRDKLNGYINELANLVPLVNMSSKRLDKTSVLRLSAAYLRLNKTANTIKRHSRFKSSSPALWRHPKLKSTHLVDLVEAVDGFIVVTTGHGKIIYVSHSVEIFLGHQSIEMIGHSLNSFLHPSDIESVCNRIQHAYEQTVNGSQTSSKISFQCRLREKNQPRSEVITYQMVNVSGHMTINYESERSSKCFDNCGTNVLFKGFVQVIPTNPMAELSLMDANLDEYVTRHSLDGTLLYTDHRIGGIIGYMPEEVLGKSAYDFILPDDHSIALFAQKLMLSNSNGTGIIVHRLRNKAGSFTYLQSSGCLQYDKTTGQIDHFVCVSRLLVEDEGDKERDKFVKRFTPHISNITSSALYESLQVLIGPRASSASASQSVFKEKNNSVRIEEIENQPPNAITATMNDELQSMPLISADYQQQSQGMKIQLIMSPSAAQSTPLPVTPLVQSHINVDKAVPPNATQQSTVVQMDALSVYPSTSAQVITQRPINVNSNYCNKDLSLTNVGSNIANNIIELYAPNASNVNAQHVKDVNTHNMYNVNNNANAIKYFPQPHSDLSHLLGATVLTFDANQRPVISVFNPAMAALEEQQQRAQQQQQMHNNNNNNNAYNNYNASATATTINSNNNIMNDIQTNLFTNCSKLNCADVNDESPQMDTSFYSPFLTNDDDVSLQTEQQSEQMTLNVLNYDELSSPSPEAFLDFSYKDSHYDLNPFSEYKS